MPRWVVSKIVDTLNEREKSLRRAKILILGITYKSDIDDMRESPAVELMKILKEKGAIVHYTDPYVPVFPKMRKYFFHLSSINPTPKNIASYDLLLLATNHTKFDYEMFQQHAKLIVDTRGVYRIPYDNVVKA